MLPKRRNNVQILLKSQESAQECWKCKIVLQIRKGIGKVPSAIGTALIEVVEVMVVEVVVVVAVAVLLVVVVLVLVVIEEMVVVVVVVVAAAEAAKELAVAVAGVASSSGSMVAITQLFVFAVACRVAFTNVMSFAHLSSAQYSNCHPCIEHQVPLYKAVPLQQNLCSRMPGRRPS